MKIIDCDSHYLPPTVFDHVPEHLRHLLPTFDFSVDGKLNRVNFEIDPVKISEGKPPESFGQTAGVTNIDSRIEDFAKLKITKQLLCPQELAMRFNYSVEPELAAAMCRSYNIEIKKVVDAHPDKFFATALVPLQDMKAATVELNWAIRHGFKAVYLDNSFISADGTSMPTISDLIEICAMQRITIYFHSMMHHVFPFDDHYRKLQRFLPGSIQLNIYSLLMSGIFDRYPVMQVVFAEGADVHAMRSYNTVQGVFERKLPDVQMKNHPLVYFKNNISFTVDIENTALMQLLIKTFGSERLLFSTDYPHDDESGLNQLHDVDDLIALKLSNNDLENIAYKNAERIFRLV
jgi:predicted TIM-barrel fold metal-dependent hydrolase